MKSTEKQTLFLQENSMTVAELEPLTIRSGGASSNHSATLPPKKKKSAHPTGTFLVGMTRTTYTTSVHILTLRGQSLFFKILPISNTGDFIAYILATVHFRYPKLGSFSDVEYYFYHLAYQDSKVPKRFVGLNQMQCSPSFDWNWGKQNDPTACSHQLHPRFRVLQ